MTSRIETAAKPSSLVLCELADTGLPDVETYSPFCLKAHRALRLAGLAYTRRFGDMPAAHRTHNPVGQVPVLLVDGEPVADSTAILRTVDRLSGGALLRGLDARARAEAWCWEELGDTSLNGFLVAARWADAANWPAVRAAYFPGLPAPLRPIVPALVRRRVLAGLVARDVWRAGPEACWRRFETTLDQLEARSPETGFWMGPACTVADLGLFAQLHALRTDLTPGQRASVERRPALRAWLDRVHAATRAAAAVTGP